MDGSKAYCDGVASREIVERSVVSQHVSFHMAIALEGGSGLSKHIRQK